MNFKERYQYNPKTDLLGKGGFAIVYKATDTLLGRIVALKFFPNTADDKHTLIKEISRAISLEHPNLCRYYDAALLESSNLHGETDKTEVGVIEYLDGGDLKSYCITHPEEQVKLLTDVLKGLAYLHANGIIHRDLKPANILIKKTAQGSAAKITDFGISKDVGGSHTSSSLLMGTIEYMAPEQFNPAKYGIDGRIGTNLDLWSFGLMVFELVSGESLFGSRGGNSSAEQVMGNILNDDLIKDKIAHLPEPYLSAVKRCLVKDAKQRIYSANELIGLFEGIAYITPQPRATAETAVLPKSVAADTETVSFQNGSETIAISSGTISTDAEKKKNIKALIAGSILLMLIAGAGKWWINRHNLAYTQLIGENRIQGNAIFNPASLSFSEGLAAFNPNGLYGFVDKSGKQIIPAKYDFAGDFSEGLAPISNSKGLYGFIDKTGKETITPQFEFASGFSEGLAKVSLGNGYGFIEKNGHLIIPLKYESVSSFSEGMAAVSIKGKWGFIDKKAKIKIPIKYQQAYSFSEHLAAVQLNDEWQFINESGTTVISPDNQKHLYISSFSDGLARVTAIDGRIGFINHSGREIIPARSWDPTDFSDGLAPIKSNNLYGYIDKNGKVTIPANYELAFKFSNGFARVQSKGHWHFINKMGNIVTNLNNNEL